MLVRQIILKYKDSNDLPKEEESPTACHTPQTMTQEESQNRSTPTPPKQKKDFPELQRILVEKEILCVETETVKLKAEHEKLEIKPLERQQHRYNFSEQVFYLLSPLSQFQLYLSTQTN